jgi:hypothetical protein
MSVLQQRNQSFIDGTNSVEKLALMYLASETAPAESASSNAISR